MNNNLWFPPLVKHAAVPRTKKLYAIGEFYKKCRKARTRLLKENSKPRRKYAQGQLYAILRNIKGKS